MPSARQRDEHHDPAAQIDPRPTHTTIGPGPPDHDNEYDASSESEDDQSAVDTGAATDPLYPRSTLISWDEQPSPRGPSNRLMPPRSKPVGTTGPKALNDRPTGVSPRHRVLTPLHTGITTGITLRTGIDGKPVRNASALPRLPIHLSAAGRMTRTARTSSSSTDGPILVTPPTPPDLRGPTRPPANDPVSPTAHKTQNGPITKTEANFVSRSTLTRPTIKTLARLRIAALPTQGIVDKAMSGRLTLEQGSRKPLKNTSGGPLGICASTVAVTETDMAAADPDAEDAEDETPTAIRPKARPKPKTCLDSRKPKGVRFPATEQQVDERTATNKNAGAASRFNEGVPEARESRSSKTNTSGPHTSPRSSTSLPSPITRPAPGARSSTSARGPTSHPPLGPAYPSVKDWTLCKCGPEGKRQKGTRATHGIVPYGDDDSDFGEIKTLECTCGAVAANRKARAAHDAAVAVWVAEWDAQWVKKTKRPRPQVQNAGEDADDQRPLPKRQKTIVTDTDSEGRVPCAHRWDEYCDACLDSDDQYALLSPIISSAESNGEDGEWGKTSKKKKTERKKRKKIAVTFPSKQARLDQRRIESDVKLPARGRRKQM